jgi:hypothetical protein
MIRILDSDQFKALCGNNSQRYKIDVEDFPRKISVITKAQLSVLVKLLSEIKDKDGNFKYPRSSRLFSSVPLYLPNVIFNVLLLIVALRKIIY